MKKLFKQLILLVFSWVLQGNSSFAYESFFLKPVGGFGFEKAIGQTKKEGSVKVLKTLRDSEGDNYVLFHSKGTFPVVGGKSSSNMSTILQDDNIFTVTRMDPEGNPIWFFHLNNKTNPSVSIESISVSPQGNISLSISFEGSLKFLSKSQEYRSVKRDVVFFFLKKSNGQLLKDLHFSGVEDERKGLVTWGTGGEVLISLKSTSKKIVFDHGTYRFNQSYKNLTERDFFVRLKKNFFPQWQRSLEPAALRGITFFDKDHVFISFSHSKEKQGFYRQGGVISRHVKMKRMPQRGIGLALDSDGNKMWSVELKHQDYGAQVSSTREFPDGTVGLMGKMLGKSLAVGDQRTFTSIRKEVKDLFLRFNQKGLLEKSALILSPKGVTLKRGDANDSLFFANGTEEKYTVSFLSADGGDQSFSLPKENNCPGIFIVDEEHVVKSVMEPSSCKGKGGSSIDAKDLDQGHINLASGHMEAFFLHKGALALKRVKYGEKILNDEIIPGLAYRPNFFHEKTSKGKKPQYSLTYAIPKEVSGAVALFVPKGVDHLEAMKNPLYQMTLNLAYMRGYIPMTIWSDQENLLGVKVEELFERLYEKKIFDKNWRLYFIASGERANQINSLYKDESLSARNIVNPKLLVLWNLTQAPDSEVGDEKIKRQVKRSRPTLFVTSWDRPEIEKKSHQLYMEFDRQKKKSSHIIAKNQPVRPYFFAAIAGMDKEKSQFYLEELKKRDCLIVTGELKNSPDSIEFKSKCFEGTKTVKGLSFGTKQQLFSFLKEIYSPQTMVPFYDKEMFNFFVGLK